MQQYEENKDKLAREIAGYMHEGTGQVKERLQLCMVERLEEIAYQLIRIADHFERD